MTIILDGKDTSNKIIEKIKEDIITLKNRGITPSLHLILIGADSGSIRYTGIKVKRAEEVGISAILHHFEKTTTAEVISLIEKLNNDPKTHGIMVQLPVSKDVNEAAIVEAISPEKDVDGLSPITFGKILMGEKAFLPAGVDAVMELLNRFNVEWEGKHWVIAGLTPWLGKPLIVHLLNKKVQVTGCSADDPNILEMIKMADILVIEVYRKHEVIASMVKKGVVVIDNGNNYEGKKVYGDVDTDEVTTVASAITPVPGGTGPLLITMLLQNTVKAAQGYIL
jgi:methylenetetrahydrofolate dehydrogenase (NADP+) / methenyltetrahydrofolate cyclohydrolase